MATISNIHGRRIVQVMLRGHRRTASVGRLSYSDTRMIATHVERLARAADWNIPAPAETQKWLSEISDRLHARLVRIGLAASRHPRESLQLEPYFNAYIKRRTDLKERSRINLEQVRNSAVRFFGAARELPTITKGEAKDWRRSLAAEYAQATVSMHVKRLRQLFADAADRKLISENPFDAVNAGTQVNAARMRYITRGDVAKVIDACPDAQWRLLFALARFAGLRIPSEIHHLRWTDIDFARNRFTVRSSKTEHHLGKDTRVVPIFPALLPYLQDAQAIAPEGEMFVLPRLRFQQLRNPAMDIVRRAGVTVWPKVFQNLRASCETDLAASNPLHLACTWIGNSTGVAMRHYLTVTDADYERAAKALHSVSPEIRTSGEQGKITNEDLLEKLRSLVEGLPPVGVEDVASRAKAMQAAHKALQHALHSTESRAARLRSRLIANLRSKVTRAKRRIGGRP